MKFKLTNFDYFDDGYVTSTFEVDAPTAEQGEIMIKKQLSKLLRNYPAGQLFVMPVQVGSLPQEWNTVPNVMGGPALPGVANGPWNGGQWQAQTTQGQDVYIPNNGQLVGGTVQLPNGSWQTITSDGSISQTTTANLSIQPGDTVILSGLNSAGSNNTYTITNSGSAPISFTPESG